jgi:hypothetical protein
VESDVLFVRLAQGDSVGKFNVYLTDNLEVNKHYQKPDVLYDEISSLSYAMLDFTEMYKFSEWVIRFETIEFNFILKELRLIWEDIPEALNKLYSSDTASSVLAFTEQGYSRAIHMESFANNLIKVSILDYESRVDTKQHSYFIPKQDYLVEWRSFLEKFINRLVEDEKIKSDDESIVAYLRLIPKP